MGADFETGPLQVYGYKAVVPWSIWEFNLQTGSVPECPAPETPVETLKVIPRQVKVLEGERKQLC